MATGLDALDMPNRKFPVRMSREQRLAAFKQYWCRYLAEDPQDGTDLDCAVLKALDEIGKSFPDKNETDQ